MAFCSKCGAQMNDGSAFCPSCGAATQAQQQQQQQYQQPQYQQPQYQQPQYQQPQYQQPVKQPANGLAVASLVCGLLSFFVAAFIFGLLSVIFGGVAKSKGNRGGMATAGIVLGIIALVVWLICVIAFESMFGMFF